MYHNGVWRIPSGYLDSVARRWSRRCHTYTYRSRKEETDIYDDDDEVYGGQMVWFVQLRGRAVDGDGRLVVG